MQKRYWAHGEITLLALLADMSPKRLSAILRRQAGVGVATARRLEAAARELGHKIHWTDWLLNRHTEHRAFRK